MALSVDAEAEGRIAREIEHHRRIASRAEAIWNWETPAGRRRAERRASLLASAAGLAPARRALELGCGTGVFLELAAASGARIVGLDLSTDLLRKARERLAGVANVALRCGNAEQLPFPDASFDAVYGSSVLHHLDVRAALREVRRVLKPGGRMAFAEPNLLNPQIAVTFSVRPLRRRLGVSPDEMAFSKAWARRAAEEVGLADVEVRPFDFLHPSSPTRWIGLVESFGRLLERVPVVREFSGSLLVSATKR
jgi:SAM-dependent methyltransferase